MEAAFREKSYPANYPADALAIINAMSFSDGKNVKILGSMGMRSQQYAGDYDLFEKVQTKGSEQEALRGLADKFQQIIKTLLGTKNVFIGDIKSGAIPEWEILNSNAGIVNEKVENYNAVECRHRIDELEKAKVISGGEAKFAHSLIKDTMTAEDLIEAKKELKFHIVRWSPSEVLQGSKVLRDKKRYTLEEAFSSHSLSKLDVIGFVQNNRFTDFSIIYEFFNNGKALNNFPLNVAQALKEDVIYYKSHGNHFKVLKRMLALAKLNKDSTTVDKLIPVLNSDLGRLYLIISDVGTLIELLENERKVPMNLVRFQLDQMKARMGNIYNLPDFLSEEHDLIGDINAILKMTNKAQLLSRLHQIKSKMEGILNTNAKVKGGRRRGGATERERGIAARLREKYYSGTSASPFNNNLYQDLSYIAHDPYDEPVATGESGLVKAGRPHLQALAKGMLSGVMPSGYPLERLGFFDPVSQQRLPPPPANAGVASEPPADNTWFEPSGRYNETDDVWRAFVLGNPASQKRELQRPNTTPIDDAALKAVGFNPSLFSMGSSFPTVNPAVYGRFSKNPPPTWDKPTTIETGATPEGIQADISQMSMSAMSKEQDKLDAAMRARTEAESQRVAREIPERDEAEMNAYKLLLIQGKKTAQRARELLPQASAELAQQQLQTPEFESAVGDFTGNILDQAKAELAADPAYQAQLRSQDEGFQAEQARLAQEALAAQEAQAEQLRLAEEASKATKAERARAVKEATAQADREEKERLQREALAGKPIEETITLERVAQLGKDRGEAERLLKSLKADRASLKPMTATKKEMLKTKAQIDEMNEIAKKKPMTAKGKKALAELEEKYELDSLIVANEPEISKKIRESERALEAILARNPAPLPKKEAEEKKGLSELLEFLSGGPKGETEDDIIASLEGVSETGKPTPLYTDEEVKENIEAISRPEVKPQFPEFIREYGNPISNGLLNAVGDALPEWKANNEKAIIRKADEFSMATKKFLLKFLIGRPFNVLYMELDPAYLPAIEKVITRTTNDKTPIDPEAQKLQFFIRKVFKNDIESGFLENIRLSFDTVTDKELLDLELMSQEAVRLLDLAESRNIASSFPNILKQMDKYMDIFEADTPEEDALNFIKGDSPIVQEWLRIVRKRLAGMSSLARTMFYLSVAYRNMNPSQATDVRVPDEWLQGDIKFRGVSGKGRKRGGVLPRSGRLSDDRATRQQEFRAMTEGEMKSIIGLPISDRYLFYAIHNEIPIDRVPLHNRGRTIVQSMRDSITKPVAVPQIPYGATTQPLGVREVALQPRPNQYRYYRWAYGLIPPDYIEAKRKQGWSDERIKNSARTKVYVTDWLDTPKPPPEWGNRYDLSNSYQVQPKDWGVDTRVNETAPRVASGRVRGEGNFFSRRKVAPEPNRRTVSHSPVAEVAERVPTIEGLQIVERDAVGLPIQATKKDKAGREIPQFMRDTDGTYLLDRRGQKIPQPRMVHSRRFPTAGVIRTGEEEEVVEGESPRPKKMTKQRRGTLYPARDNPVYTIVTAEVISDMEDEDLVEKHDLLHYALEKILRDLKGRARAESNTDYKIMKPQYELVRAEMAKRGL
jgi:hypothetical protein